MNLQFSCDALTSREFRFGTHLFVKVPRPGDSEVTFWVIESAATIPLSALPKDTTSELAGLSPY